jgi:hypothetical protein
MTKEKLKRVFQFYLTELAAEAKRRKDTSAPRQLPEAESRLLQHYISAEAELAHLRFMCIEAQKFVDEDRVEKAMRWLGFLQGVLWAREFYSLDDLKNHSRPDGSV